jgi:outer membrane protein assembly factor BamB
MKKASMKGGIVILASLMLAVVSQADIIIVDDDGPADFNNIQAAIDDSNDGDIIFVFPGTYTGPGNRDIDFAGRGITVQSVAPQDAHIVAATVIDCEGQGRGFNFNSGEDANSVLNGLTITNGYADYGGGIRCQGGSPTIVNCTVSACSASQDGGGLFGCDGVENCIVSKNTAGRNGGGMARCYRPTNCIIRGNWASQNGGGLFESCDPFSCIVSCNTAAVNGAGIYEQDECDGVIINCTIGWNTALSGQGGGICGLSGGVLANCILWGNTDSTSNPDYPEFAHVYSPFADVSFSCIEDEEPNDANIPFGGADNGNIDDYPLFAREPNDGGDGWGDDPCTSGVDEGANDDFGDLHLRIGSPCLNTGNPAESIPGRVDMDGEPRIMGRIIDMGADEFLIPTIIVTRPQAGDVWVGGSRHEIRWESIAVDGNVDISYVTDGYQWVTLEESATNTGSYMWHLPDIEASQCRVVVGAGVPNPKMAIGSGLFTIHPDSPGPAVTSTWKSLAGDFDRLGRSDYRGPQLGCVKWEFEVDGAISASVTVGPNETVYVPCEDGNLYTLDANGSVLWTYEAQSPLISAATLGPDGTAYVGSKDGKLYAIDIDGNLRWTHTTDGFVFSSPAVSPDGNQVYVCSEDGRLYALGRDGSDLWSFETAGFGVVGGAILASPTVAEDGTVYIGGLYDSNLYALDPNDGNTNWVCDFNSDGWLFASPVVAPDGTIYQTLLYDPNLYAIDANDGNIIWATHLAEYSFNPDYQEFRSYWFEPDHYDFSDIDFRTCEGVYDLSTGWPPSTWSISDSAWSEPVVGRDGRIHVNFDDPWLRVVEPNGAIERILKVGSQSGFSLTADSDGFVYAAGNDSNLYALNPGGFEIARFDSNDYWLDFPVVSTDNTLIVGDSRNNSLLISYENNKVQAISSDGCGGQELDLYWQGGPQDLNGDGVVGYLDVAIVAQDWLRCTKCSDRRATCGGERVRQRFLEGDVNRDLYVNFADIALIAERWSAGY